MRKRIISLLLLVSIIISSSMTVFAEGTAEGIIVESSIKTKDEFIDKVEQNDFYKEYEALMTTKEPLIVNNVYDEDNNVTGYITQYEVELEHLDNVSNQDLIIKTTINSLLVFIHNKATDTMNALLIDYSDIDTKKEINLRDLTTGDLEVIPIDNSENEILNELSEEIKENKATLVEKAQYSIDNVQTRANDCETWRCTQYISGDHDWDNKCSLTLGLLCALAPLEVFGSVVCFLGTVVACWVPAYKVCVAGRWLPICEY